MCQQWYKPVAVLMKDNVGLFIWNETYIQLCMGFMTIAMYLTQKLKDDEFLAMFLLRNSC